MSSNKLYKLIEKYDLTNIIKVILLLIILFLIYRVFIESKTYKIPKSISNLYQNNVNIYEGFEQALLGNGNIYGNVITLNDPSNIPEFTNNTCILKLSTIYRIDTLALVFNSSQNITISFIDGNGNTKYIKNSKSSSSPPEFKILNEIISVLDENNLIVYTSQIVLTLTNGNSFTKTTLKSYGIYGGDRNLPLLNDYNKISNSLTYNDTLFMLQKQSTPASANTITDSYTFNQTRDSMIYALKMDISISKIMRSPNVTESHFNIKISYENSIYVQNVFDINTTYRIRNDYYSTNNDNNKAFIFFTEPIIANKIIMSITRINTDTIPSEKISLSITTLKVLDKVPSKTEIADFQKTVNTLKASTNAANNQDFNTCPNINDLVDTQTKTQQICDTLEFQDKVKQEKMRLEKNKQYLLKLQNQQEQIDQLNSVIQDLENKRQARAQISDQARVLQYQKQKGDASTIRDLANQRLQSQANNQLYMDVNITAD